MKLTRTLASITLMAAALMSQEGAREQVGPTADGGYLLSSGWRIKSAGTQIPVDTLPLGAVVTPDKKYLLVVNSGYNPPSVSVIDLAAGKEVSRAAVPDAWMGIAIAKAGDKVYVGGASKAAIYEFSFAAGILTPSRFFAIVAEKDRKPEDFIGDVQLSPDGHLLYASDLYRDSVVVVNPQSGIVISIFKTVHRPFRILFHPSGKSFFASSWSDGMVGQYDANAGTTLSTLRVGPHSTDMVWRDGEVDEHPGVKARLFVAASNTNSVYVFGASDSGDLSPLETINLALTPRQPAGTTPGGLSFSADGSKLLVACADINAAAVVDISGPRSRVAGFIPTGWYPTATYGLPDGRLAVLNGKGVRSYPNPLGPTPFRGSNDKLPDGSPTQFTPRIQTGTVQLVALDEAKLPGYTQEVLANSPYRDEKVTNPGTPAGNPIHAGGPIRHVIYIVKENRTYDQVLGDIKEGNGDPSLVLFGEDVTPNQHKLARDFVLLDNFYENSDVSADGQNWSTAAIAPDYTQRVWPSNYAGRNKPYGFEGTEPANLPPAGYIWTAIAQTGLTLRNYGYWVENRKQAAPDGTQIEAILDPVLAERTNWKFRSFDMDYTDVARAGVFLDDLRDFEKSGTMPNFLIMRLGNDHTSYTTPGKIAPLADVADNDQAVGMVVEAVSKSRFWNETAIFIIEDDAQNGPDHVDSHRSTCYVISPWVRRHSINSTMYNQASVLRTMELILGLRPLTTFDAGARPLFRVFANQPVPGVWTPEKPRIPLDTRNPAKGPTTARSLHLNLKDADDVDDDEGNAILWAAIKGAAGPAPVRSRFAH
jgi:DNA-binding beta-propeller fold protein YncE